jgi:hypothetical protein
MPTQPYFFPDYKDEGRFVKVTSRSWNGAISVQVYYIHLVLKDEFKAKVWDDPDSEAVTFKFDANAPIDFLILPERDILTSYWIVQQVNGEAFWASGDSPWEAIENIVGHIGWDAVEGIKDGFPLNIKKVVGWGFPTGYGVSYIGDTSLKVVRLKWQEDGRDTYRTLKKLVDSYCFTGRVPAADLFQTEDWEDEDGFVPWSRQQEFAQEVANANR